MEFKAHPLSVDNLFSLRKQYYVSRNQREFSWVEEQLQEFWFDLLSNIKLIDDKFEHQEYFLGTIVLAGNEDGFRLSIVDGQQRLTIITILICAICQRLKELDNESVGKSFYNNYIEGVSIDEGDDNEESDKYFKLDRQSDSDFFKLAIQYYNKTNENTNNLEDELLKQAYNYFYDKLISTETIVEKLQIQPEKVDNQATVKFIRAVAKQLTTKIKIIRVIVDNEDDAYVIFEILNARGMDLDSADLIKNKIFSDMRKSHPVDYAEKGWNKMITEFSDRNKNFKLTNYIRHWWSGHYAVVSEGSLYKSFKQKIIEGEINSESFLTKISNDASVYAKILDPRFDDWREQHAKQIYYSLLSLKIFNVSICRPFLLSLFEAFSSKKIRYNELSSTLKMIEKFHFLFNAIGSQRPSGVENTYSFAARKLLEAKGKHEARAALQELKEKLINRVPPESTFIQKFKEIKYTKKKTTHRRLIQYIYATIERNIRGNDEVVPLDITLEHITPQATGLHYIGMIGNLLPLGSSGNLQAKTSDFPKKIEIYKRSNFIYTKNFCEENKNIDIWSEAKIISKTEEIASLAYNTVWKI
ncbi:DUF262 domain-containing protein [Enterobacter cloacae complex sp. IR5378]|uniref:DUF262 domain-containing protein n=1 Tax=Enterobacter cloacae complex TaxID=354276 RepID=UPI0020759545|nr:DUF262 domain-containing protein [Enterobacter hormaechei]MCM7731645.1 DUF262 domain-containing HNH endonuclease family protein [Enterobacter hormaechei]MCW4756000.1 DUF262 domain-containing HNH endonuclease family protein [Enterobacter hormaechei]UAS93940.1 DUF262 domain-containing HNH endonuclease family protein [Enterobacter cloacae complex sp.]